jgi:hypothetical protein
VASQEGHSSMELVSQIVITHSDIVYFLFLCIGHANLTSVIEENSKLVLKVYVIEVAIYPNT